MLLSLITRTHSSTHLLLNINQLVLLQLDIRFFNDLKEIDINDHRESDKYDLISHTAVRNEKFYPCCSEPYLDLTFSAVFKRKNTS